MKINWIKIAIVLAIGLVGVYLILRLKDKVVSVAPAASGSPADQFVRRYGYAQNPQSPLGFPSEQAQYADFMWQLYGAQSHPTNLLSDPFQRPRYGGAPRFFAGKIWVNQNGKIVPIGNYSNEAQPSQIMH